MVDTQQGTGVDKRGILIRISSDGMLATLQIQGDRVVPSRAAILQALDECRVVAGVDQAMLDALIAHTVNCNDEVPIAQGIPATHGKDAIIEYAFPIPTENRPFDLGDCDDGSVDFHAGRLIQHVAKGEVIARKIPAGLGSNGVTVNGQPVVGRPGRDLNLAAGRNVRIDGNGAVLVATCAGVPVVEGSKIHVTPLYEAGAVNLETGDIHNLGPVLVKGDVEAGFKVAAVGNIEVIGTVEGGTLVATGNIIVRGGIRNHAKVQAGGSIRARFVDSGSELRAFGDINIQADAIQSRVEACRNIIIGRHVIGGHVHGGLSVEASAFGTDRGTPTFIEIAWHISSGILESLRAQKDAAEVRLHEIVRKIEGFGTPPPRAFLPSIRKLVTQEVQARIEVQALEAQARDCELKLSIVPREKARVKSHRPLLPGVTVVIQGMVFEPVLTGGSFVFAWSDNAGVPWIPSDGAGIFVIDQAPESVRGPASESGPLSRRPGGAWSMAPGRRAAGADEHRTDQAARGWGRGRSR